MHAGHLARRAFFRDCEGSNLVELALVLPILLMIFAAAIDFGIAFYINIELSSAAQAGASYGIQNPTDISGMQTAGLGGGSNLDGEAVSATYGCECSDGSSAVPLCTTPPTCTYNYVNYVDVTATAPFSPVVSIPGLLTATTFRNEVRLRVGGD